MGGAQGSTSQRVQDVFQVGEVKEGMRYCEFSPVAKIGLTDWRKTPKKDFFLSHPNNIN